MPCRALRDLARGRRVCARGTPPVPPGRPAPAGVGTTPCWSSAARWEPATTTPAVDRADEGHASACGAAARADAGDLPRTPAAGRRAGRPGRSQPARAAARAGAGRVDRQRSGRRAHGPVAQGVAKRGVHWNQDWSSSCRREHRSRGHRYRASCRRPGSRRWRGGCSGTPRSTYAVLRAWAEGDRADHLERGIDQEALLAEVDAAREELDTAGARWPSASPRSPVDPGEPAVTRKNQATGRANLSRLGFGDTERARRDLALLETYAEPLLALLGATADPGSGAERAAAARRQGR